MRDSCTPYVRNGGMTETYIESGHPRLVCARAVNARSRSMPKKAHGDRSRKRSRVGPPKQGTRTRPNVSQRSARAREGKRIARSSWSTTVSLGPRLRRKQKRIITNACTLISRRRPTLRAYRGSRPRPPGEIRSREPSAPRRHSMCENDREFSTLRHASRCRRWEGD